MAIVEIHVKKRWWAAPRRTVRLKRDFPRTWNELTRQQLLKVCHCFLLSDRLPVKNRESYLKLLLLWKLMKIPRSVIREMTSIQAAHLTLRLKYLFKMSSLTEQKIPTLWIDHVKCIGPRSHFENLKLDEFIVAEKYYELITDNQDQAALDGLVCTLYRPENMGRWTDEMDNREHFNPVSFGQRMEMIGQVKAVNKVAVLYWYVGCRLELMSMYELLFSGGGGDQEEGGRSADWLDFLRHLPGEKFGTLAQIEQSYVHPVFEVAHRMMIDTNRAADRNQKSKAS